MLLFKLDSRIVEGAPDEPLQVVYRVFNVGDLGLLSCDNNWGTTNEGGLLKCLGYGAAAGIKESITFPLCALL